jgi:glycosyltransferase involved in cell wall biosynthesis
VGCEKWKTECYHCEQKNEYPKSLIFDRSRQNFLDKKRIFTSLQNLTIVPVSNWLAEKVSESFLSEIPLQVIQNGIDLKTFYPKNSREFINEKYELKDKFIILGVASTWDKRKGFDEFIKLNDLIDKNIYSIILVGLDDDLLKKIPSNIIGIKRTESVNELADLYSAADVFVNPTFEDTFPTTNLESLACGTPIITYKTGGSTESVSEDTGIIINKGDVVGLLNAVESIKNKGKNFYVKNCINSAILNFDRKIKFNEYFKLYNELLNKK